MEEEEEEEWEEEEEEEEQEDEEEEEWHNEPQQQSLSLQSLTSSVISCSCVLYRSRDVFGRHIKSRGRVAQ